MDNNGAGAVQAAAAASSDSSSSSNSDSKPEQNHTQGDPLRGPQAQSSTLLWAGKVATRLDERRIDCKAANSSHWSRPVLLPGPQFVMLSNWRVDCGGRVEASTGQLDGRTDS